jgi:hypothetical protein
MMSKMMRMMSTTVPIPMYMRQSLPVVVEHYACAAVSAAFASSVASMSDAKQELCPHDFAINH